MIMRRCVKSSDLVFSFRVRRLPVFLVGRLLDWSSYAAVSIDIAETSIREYTTDDINIKSSAYS